MTNWTKEELLAYILVWSANADFVERPDEIELILSKVDSDTYKKMHREFHGDNDSRSIDKIAATLKRLAYSESEIDRVFEDMMEMYKADGKFDSLERSLHRGLRRIFG